MQDKPPYLHGENVEDVARMLMALLSEFWILRDRVAILEELLGEKIGVGSDVIDAYSPSPEFEARLQVLRDQVARNVVGAPLLARDRSIDTILETGGLKPKA
jgi:hypothetical protein